MFTYGKYILSLWRMAVAQLHLYVPEKVAKELRRRAGAQGLSVSRYLGQLARHEASDGWPEGYFDEVVGGWSGGLERPPQGAFEKREAV